MTPFDWDPNIYLDLMRQEVPDYERLQEEATAATGIHASRILELGTGTGETARRVLARHPQALLVGVDASSEMLSRASAALPPDRVQLLVARLEDPVPNRPFDVVVSVLAIHHLTGPRKADLFKRLTAVLAPGGRIVLGDVFIPGDRSDAVTPIDGDYDTPSGLADQRQWMQDAGLTSSVAWAHRDLAFLIAEAPATD